MNEYRGFASRGHYSSLEIKISLSRENTSIAVSSVCSGIGTYSLGSCLAAWGISGRARCAKEPPEPSPPLRRTAAPHLEEGALANLRGGDVRSRASEEDAGRALETARHGRTWGGRAGHGGRAKLLRYLRQPPGLTADTTSYCLEFCLSCPPDLFALAHRCHLHRVAGRLRTLHTL